MSEECRKYVIRVGDKEIFLGPDVMRVLHEYLHRPMSLEELARRLGLETWEEAYEVVKKVPAWALWTPLTMWILRLKKEGCISESEAAEA
ncbi:MAG: hypothetical protein GXO09_04635 [Crenarchaeota archaeon]|nr:hypothetical protein [Thermoproteota archaeon]